MPSRLTSRAAAYQGQAARAAIASAQVNARMATGIAIESAREAARINSYMAPTNVLSAIDAGDGTATIQMIEHSRVYPVQGAIKVDDLLLEAADILAQPLDTPDLYVFYDDVTLADTTPALQVTDDEAVAQVGYAPGRHLIGVVTTPAAGGAATTGTGGSAPPGGGGARPITHSTA